MIVTEEQKHRIESSVILAAVGDAIGYFGGRWEFNFNGRLIWNELTTFFINVESLPIWRFMVSDDTIMQKGTMMGLGKPFQNLDELMQHIFEGYCITWKEMGGRGLFE